MTRVLYNYETKSLLFCNITKKLVLCEIGKDWVEGAVTVYASLLSVDDAPMRYTVPIVKTPRLVCFAIKLRKLMCMKMAVLSRLMEDPSRFVDRICVSMEDNGNEYYYYNGMMLLCKSGTRYSVINDVIYKDASDDTNIDCGAKIKVLGVIANSRPNISKAVSSLDELIEILDEFLEGR